MSAGTAARPSEDEAARIRLGALPTTAPAVLEALARDLSVTVRAAVALNVATPPSADLILATDPDERVRTVLARRLAALLPGLDKPEQAALREQALCNLMRLVADEALRVRAMIAELVKEMPTAPRELILRLAADAAIAVCGPVLRLSPLLGPADLLTLLADSPCAQAAGAIARRASLPPEVCEAVARTADTMAIRTLLANRSAAIRESTLDALIACAGEQPEWQEPLVQRPALSASAARALAGIVATEWLEVLARRRDLDPALFAELREKLHMRLDPPAPADIMLSSVEATEAMRRARAMRDAGTLDEEALIAAAREGDGALCAAMLALAADVPIHVVRHACALRNAKGFVSLAWKAAFPMRVAALLQAALGQIPPGEVLHGDGEGGYPLTIEEMRWQLGVLTRMG